MIRGISAANALLVPTGNIKNIRILWPINDQNFYFSPMKASGVLKYEPASKDNFL
jgi:hypothetical protein